MIDGPNASVPRQSIPYRSLILTPYTLAALPRAAGSGAIKKAFEKAGVQAKWEASSWAKKLQAREERKVASDFARFEILLAKKSRRDLVSTLTGVRSLRLEITRCITYRRPDVVPNPFCDTNSTDFSGPQGPLQGEEGCHRLDS